MQTYSVFLERTQGNLLSSVKIKEIVIYCNYLLIRHLLIQKLNQRFGVSAFQLFFRYRYPKEYKSQFWILSNWIFN